MGKREFSCGCSMFVSLVGMLIAMMAGCGLHTEEGGTVATATAIGIDKCYNCHAGTAIAGKNIFLTWASSTHARQSTFYESKKDSCGARCHASDPIKYPDGCYGCHDPDRDSMRLSGYLGPGSTPFPRSVVGCEACHGGGSFHFGAGPLAYPKPDYARCSLCHKGQGEEYVLSRHVSGLLFNTGKCAKCHNDEGARAYKDVMTKTALNAIASTPVTETPSPIQCRTCHDAHNPGKLLKEGEAGLESAEYATCTNCHGKDDDAVDNLLNHGDSYYRVICDSHYDDPATLGTIEGYVIDPTNEHACADCHDSHAVKGMSGFSGTSTIHLQWSQSGHAGKIGSQKAIAARATADQTTTQVKAIKTAGATEESGPAWVHYPWTAIGRKTCAQCHTATAVKTYLDDPADYATNLLSLYNTTGPSGAFKTLYGTNIAAGGKTVYALQKELLYCWACHADNKGAMRDPGPITANYDYVSSAGTLVLTNSFTYPGIKKANVCMACHLGRQNGDTIKNLATAAGVTINFSNLSFVNSHYLAAGGTLFGVTGYEYAGRSYDNLSYYEHDRVGLSATTAAAVGGTDVGPCVGCHMASTAGHTFEVVAKDAGEVITTIRSAVCVVCHTGQYTLSAVVLIEEKEGMEAALQALKVAVADSTLHPAFYFSTASPYFFKTPTSTARTNAVKNWANIGAVGSTINATGKKNMGAAFNFNLLHHDSGAYSHNKHYTQLLIFDSLDWLDDNVMAGVVNLSAYANSTLAAAYLRSDANSQDPVSALRRP